MGGLQSSGVQHHSSSPEGAIMGSPSTDRTQDYDPSRDPARGARSSDAPASPPAQQSTTVDSPTTTESGATPALPRRPFPTIPGYEIEAELGRGGMGVVYRARHTALKRAVALKVIRGGADATDDQLQRFRIEAQAVAQLQHAHIVQIYEVGEHEGAPFCALEYVSGGSLAATIRGQPVAADRAASLLETLARAVYHAHQKGIVHRDLKPGNILLAADGAPKIADFGLAKRYEADDSNLTRTGAVVGTPAYMAPEQAAGHIKAIGPATDIYALGVILYELVTGVQPFRGDSAAAVMQMVQTVEPAPPSRIVAGIPRDLETICLKCLQKEPARRYTSALALAQDIERFRAGEPILARREGVVRKAWRLLRKRGLVIGLCVTVLAAIAIAAGLSYREFRARQATALSRTFDDQLDAADWPAGHADRLEVLVADLRGLDAELADTAQRRLLDRAGKRIREALARPRVNAEDVPAIEAHLAWLAARDADAAAPLERDLRQRLRAWQPVIQLAPPFDVVPTVFAPGAVRTEVGTEALQRSAGAPVVAITHPSRGNVRLTAMLAPGWENAQDVGLVIHHRQDADTAGYRFVVAATAPELPEDGVPSKADKTLTFQRTGRHAELRVLRNGVVLRRQTVRLPAGPLTILAERDVGQLRAQVNDLPAITFTDPIPLTGSAGTVLGILWPQRVGVARLRVDESALPPAASPLESADEAFDRGRLADALQLYN
jgi:serine/threonine-protein kinase